MKYRLYNPGRLMLFPPAISDMTAQDSPMWLIMHTVDSQLVEGLEASKSEEGNTAYNPLMMSRLPVWAYYNKIFSSRVIERRCCTDVKINPADPDARFIRKSKGGGHTMGYNGGLAVV